MMVKVKIEDHLQKVRSCTSRDLVSKESMRSGERLQVMRADFERHHSGECQKEAMIGSFERHGSMSRCELLHSLLWLSRDPCRSLRT